MKIKREKRLNSEFKKVIYELLSTKVKDPRLTEMFSITNVETTDDLKYAKVFVSIFSTNEQKKEQTFYAICDAGGFIRRELSRAMHIRTVPEFTFFLDNRQEYTDRIEQILSGITYSNNQEENEKD